MKLLTTAEYEALVGNANREKKARERLEKNLSDAWGIINGLSYVQLNNDNSIDQLTKLKSDAVNWCERLNDGR